MSLVHVALLNAQLVMGVDLSQAYNTQVFADDVETEDRDLPGEGAFMSIVAPRVAARLLYPMSEYQLEYQAGFTFYDFDPLDSELFHQAELRGTWEVGESSGLEAIEQVQYGSGNTLRQLDTTTIGITEFTAARTRYILNHGRLTYRTELGTTTQYDGTLSYLLRRSLDPESSDIPVYNYDTLAPEADMGLTRFLDEDNQIGLRVRYNHYLTPDEAGGDFFDDGGRITVDGMLMYGHRFYPRLQTSVEAGLVVGRSLEPENDYTHLEPAGALNAIYTTPYVIARARLAHGFGSYGVTAGTARFTAGSVGLNYVPDPMSGDLSFYGTFDARLTTEVVADLRTQHRTMDGTIGVRYEINDYVRVFASYDYRYQDQRNGQPELAVNFKRHVVTIGISGEFAIPRRIDDGENPDAALEESPP